MNHTATTSMSRRKFLAVSSIIAAGALLPPKRLGAEANKNSKLRILQIGAGGVGELDRSRIKTHSRVEFVGFCDIDKNILAAISKEYPDAFTLADYRLAFADHGKKFDAVVIDTPDFDHAPMLLTAMSHGKHVYGQKPLVHQLDEIRMVREAVTKLPGLVTQMGNQRAQVKGRKQAVELLKSNQLGRPVEAHVWTGELRRDSHFAAPWSPIPKPGEVPGNVSWDLWNGPLMEPFGYDESVHPRRWRAYWDTGSGQLGDWGCHLIDVLYYAYDLPSPVAVQTNTIRAANTGHSAYNQSTLTYPGGDRFAKSTFRVHYNDSMITPSFAALGLPAMQPGVNHTMIVCEEGTLLLGDLGKLQVFRAGKLIESEPLPDLAEGNHWHDWVNRCLDGKTEIWSPFSVGVRITEPALLSVKATRFPGTDLRWDGASCRFTNHGAANEQIVKRAYRDGFAPPDLSA